MSDDDNLPSSTCRLSDNNDLSSSTCDDLSSSQDDDIPFLVKLSAREEKKLERIVAALTMKRSVPGTLPEQVRSV